jgi:hypothetical protein
MKQPWRLRWRRLRTCDHSCLELKEWPGDLRDRERACRASWGRFYETVSAVIFGQNELVPKSYFYSLVVGAGKSNHFTHLCFHNILSFIPGNRYSVRKLFGRIRVSSNRSLRLKPSTKVENTFFQQHPTSLLGKWRLSSSSSVLGSVPRSWISTSAM